MKKKGKKPGAVPFAEGGIDVQLRAAAKKSKARAAKKPAPPADGDVSRHHDACRWLDHFRVRPGHAPDLGDDAARLPRSAPRDKAEAKAWLLDETDRLVKLQRRFYADGRRALLVVFQALDTGGKDGAIRGVFGPLNPQGVRVQSFKRPTPVELAHDFLWRVHAAVPEHGMIGVFNRSHYEDVLVARVHRLAGAQALERRYRQINDFEHLLADNRVVIRKFMLHITKDEQKARLQERLDNASKHWKFEPADLAEREHWDEYMEAYTRALSECSTEHAPWYVIPANEKWYRDWAVARILRETMSELELRYPEASFDPARMRVT